MEQRITAIESAIKEINSQLNDSGKVNAVIASEMKGIRATLGKLADNQADLIKLRANTDHIVVECSKRHTECKGNFDETFTRLRDVEQGKIASLELDKCKEDVLCLNAKILKPIKDDVFDLKRNQRIGIASILTLIVGTAIKKVFWP